MKLVVQLFSSQKDFQSFITYIVTAFLGVVIVAYALYALFNPTLPELAQRSWAYGFGFAGGVLSGAYNTSGPPVVIYGTCRCWQPAEFKSNLQGYFLLTRRLANSQTRLTRLPNCEQTAPAY